MNDFRRSENPTKPTTSNMTVEHALNELYQRGWKCAEAGYVSEDDKKHAVVEALAAIEAHYAAIRKADMEYVAGEIDLYDSKEVRQYIKSAQERMAERLNNTEEQS